MHLQALIAASFVCLAAFVYTARRRSLAAAAVVVAVAGIALAAAAAPGVTQLLRQRTADGEALVRLAALAAALGSLVVLWPLAILQSLPIYTLTLCLRYLRSRLLAYFAMLGVALCVAMMLIVISVMNGFLDKIENAAKGLFGDIVVEPASVTGMGYYDEFIAEAKQKVPQIEAGSPFIITYGLLTVPGYDLRRPLQVAGIRLPERAEVSAFDEGLFAQQDAPPSFDPPFELLADRVEQSRQKIQRIIDEKRGEPLTAHQVDLIGRMQTAATFHQTALATLRAAQPYQDELRQLQQRLDAMESRPDVNEQELLALERRLDEVIEQSGFRPPDSRVILGSSIPGLSFRTPEGETVRYIVPGHRIDLMLLPLGRRFTATETPVTRRFSVVDDSTTDVASIDNEIVYVPFETLQRLNNMGPEYAYDSGGNGAAGQIVTPGRTSAIHFKVRGEQVAEAELVEVAGELQELWSDFAVRYPRAAAGGDVSVQTWRQRQQRVIAPIESQRTLVVTMFGIISLVSVVMIFVIFYMIVVQKTRDIGVLKAVGASSSGVAAIFLAYGAAVGLAGSIAGTIIGYYFIININPIHDWIGRWLGFQVWSRETFMFTLIPDTVDWTAAVFIVIGAIVAGLVGAIIPAVRAARMQPVEALRYE